MAGKANGASQRSTPIALTVLDDGTEDDAGEEVFIVYGEAGEDLAFEICEDLEIALDVRESMQEDGFKVRLFQANEVEVMVDDEPSSPGGGAAA